MVNALKIKTGERNATLIHINNHPMKKMNKTRNEIPPLSTLCAQKQISIITEGIGDVLGNHDSSKRKDTNSMAHKVRVNKKKRER